MAPGTQTIPQDASASQLAHFQSPASTLSVMTFNVKGLPWPVVSGRAAALEEIGSRLTEMRSQGVQPHVVMLQEAFSDAARTIGERSGYAYNTNGPETAPAWTRPPLGQPFAQAARWDRGETSGNLLGSGLVIMSDYPILRSRAMAFPQGACAGFDCLASKGVVIAWIEVPGSDRPIAFVNTHLNSRNATHVALDRADAAFAWQVAAVQRFLDENIDPETAVIFGGDFNVGDIPERRRSFAQNLPLGEAQLDSLAEIRAAGMMTAIDTPEFEAIASRNKDMILYRPASGEQHELVPTGAAIPFPFTNSAAPLSDHPGFTVEFDFRSRP